MIATSLAIAITVCASSVVAYIAFLIYNSKCTKCKANMHDGLQVTRDTDHEARISSFRFRIPFFGSSSSPVSNTATAGTQ